MKPGCSICGESFTGKSSDVVHATKCGHLFHLQCLGKWLTRSKTCPKCRAIVIEGQTIRVYMEDLSTLKFNDYLEDQLKAYEKELKELKEVKERYWNAQNNNLNMISQIAQITQIGKRLMVFMDLENPLSTYEGYKQQAMLDNQNPEINSQQQAVNNQYQYAMSQPSGGNVENQNLSDSSATPDDNQHTQMFNNVPARHS